MCLLPSDFNNTLNVVQSYHIMKMLSILVFILQIQVQSDFIYLFIYFLTCIALNVRPHDLCILFCTVSLFMDHMIFISQFGKKMHALLC